jgi:hypothetical protein
VKLLIPGVVTHPLNVTLNEGLSTPESGEPFGFTVEYMSKNGKNGLLNLPDRGLRRVRSNLEENS